MDEDKRFAELNHLNTWGIQFLESEHILNSFYMLVFFPNRPCKQYQSICYLFTCMSHQGLDNAALVCKWQIRPDSLKYLEVCVSVWRSKPCVSVSSRLAHERGAACIRCDLQCMLCVKRKTTAPDREPSGTWLVCVRLAFARFDLLPVCVCLHGGGRLP